MYPVIIDGPEKAGKSTFIRHYATLKGWKVRKLSGPAEPNFMQYYEFLKKDIQSQQPVIWDRSWASEFVYGSLMLDRKVPEPHTMEEVLSPLTSARIILLGPGTLDQFLKRDGSDMPVNLDQEREHFRRYGLNFGWTVLANDYSLDWLKGLQYILDGMMWVHKSNRKPIQLTLGI